MAKLALLIGTRTYQDPKFHRLAKSDKDVTSLARALTDPRIGAFDGVDTSIDEPFATVLRRVGRLFADRGHDDLLLMYFAGHGVKDEQGQLHLATIDTDASILQSTALGADHLTAVMNRSRSRKQLLILDCCFSGAFTGTRAPTTVDATSTFADAAGRIILTATDSFQYAWEDEATISETNSVFTHYLVDGLTTGKADADEDGIITADEWYEYVYNHVRMATPKQTPQRSMYRGAGTFAIAHNPFLGLSLPPDLTIPMASILPTVREAAVHELARLLNDPRLAQSARHGLEQLAKDRDARVRSIAETVLVPVSLLATEDSGIEAKRKQDEEKASANSDPSHTFPLRLKHLQLMVAAGVLVVIVTLMVLVRGRHPPSNAMVPSSTVQNVKRSNEKKKVPALVVPTVIKTESAQPLPGASDTASPAKNLAVSKPHSGQPISKPTNAVFTPDGTFIAVISERGTLAETVEIVSATTLKSERRVAKDNGSMTLALSPDGQRLLTQTLYDLRLWDVASGAQVRAVKTYTWSGNVIRFDTDGRHIAAGSNFQGPSNKEGHHTIEVTLRDAKTLAKKKIFEFPWKLAEGHTAVVEDFQFSPNGRQLAIAHPCDNIWDDTSAHASQASVTVLDIATGRVAMSMVGDYRSVAWSPDGKILALATFEKVTLLNTNTWLKHHEFSGRFPIEFSSDGRFFLNGVGTARGIFHHIEVRDTRTWDLWQSVDQEEGGGVFAHFSPDGRSLMTGGTRESIRYPDGRFTSGGPNGLRIWDLTSRSVVARFQ